MSRIKICGMMRPEDIGYVNEVLPEYAGFIFAENRRRTLTPEYALELRQMLDKRIKAVGVFYDQSLDFIEKVIKMDMLDLVQLHGHESEEFVLNVKKFGLPVIKAFKIEGPDDLKIAKNSPADYCLLDNGDGGTGKRFDWSVLEGFDREFFLAGGLDCENISAAIETFEPFAVDVSSGVETDGRKDRDKIRRFVVKVRRSNLH